MGVIERGFKESFYDNGLFMKVDEAFSIVQTGNDITLVKRTFPFTFIQLLIVFCH